MFYPVDSLKRGGRFYLCWVADSWPLRFATITHRQLWSQDIRKICDDLLQVMTNESGRPANRFSLRLSSQLMRGLVRLYQRKVSAYLSELCMMTANVIKHSNKKYHILEVIDLHEDPAERRRQVIQRLPQLVLTEELENEQRVEEMIQNSGNVVINVQDITLKEAAIPDFQLPPNDGFGEENINQTLGQLADRTVEMMMAPTDAPAITSGLGAALDSTEKSHDKSRLVADLHMERISEHDMTLFKRFTGEGLLPPEELEKEIPEIPDIPIPELPPQEKLVDQEKKAPPTNVEKTPPPSNVQQVSQTENLELEELESEPQPKRRKNRRLIIDKKIIITGEVLRARINNPNVELRCENSIDDAVDLRVPFEILMKRPCHAGIGFHSKLSVELDYMFVRNLAAVERSTVADREVEMAAMQRAQRSYNRSMLDRIEEGEEPAIPPEKTFQQEPLEANITYPDITIQAPHETSKENMEIIETREQDLAEMLTQKIDTLSQHARKRASASDLDGSPKRSRHMGYISFRESQKQRPTFAEIETSVVAERTIQELEANKENIPENFQIIQTANEAENNVTAMLQEAGLADIQTYQPDTELPVSQRPRRRESNTPETMLGSLDRTKVSLGESEQTTESRRFIRDQWGTEGTMCKILRIIKKDTGKPLDINNLLSHGPFMTGYKKMIAARCFASILKLKQHGFIIIKKHAETLEVKDILLGPKFK